MVQSDSQFNSQTDAISKPEETPTLTDRMLYTKDKKSWRSLLSEREKRKLTISTDRDFHMLL